MKSAYLCLILVLAIADFSYAAVIHVPGDKPTIQAGIDAASDGDMVLVADGIYKGVGNKNLDFKGKEIIVKSEKGPQGCIIDLEYDGHGFYFHNGETSDSIVEGFTIQNGGGSGIHNIGSSPFIQNNISAPLYAGVKRIHNLA